MLKKMAWVLAAFLFLSSAGFQLFVFTCLLRWQEVLYYEYDVFINRVEFGFSLMVVAVALFTFGYCMKRLLEVGYDD